jgi:hypothetical protein
MELILVFICKLRKFDFVCGTVARKLLTTAGASMPPEGQPKKTMCLYFAFDGPAPIGSSFYYMRLV